MLATLLALGCATERPRPAPPPRCERLDRAQGTLLEVACAGRDSDGDGIDDAADLCPEALETPNGVEDADGCPDPDRDGDQVQDAEDDCPREAGPRPTGCPLRDSDGDGLADHLDSCPLDAEDLNGVEDQDGCPDGADVLVVARNDVIFVRQPIHFLAGSARLLPDSKIMLERIAAQLAPHQDRVARVRAIGHSDPREGRGRKATQLSRARAKAVADFLVRQGLPRRLVEIEAVGHRQPAARGAQREKNQRVELLVTLTPETQDQPTSPAEPGVPASGGAEPATPGPAAPGPTAAEPKGQDGGDGIPLFGDDDDTAPASPGKPDAGGAPDATAAAPDSRPAPSPEPPPVDAGRPDARTAAADAGATEDAAAPPPTAPPKPEEDIPEW